ncbi:hypothetical protein M758_4G245200 [Ceratodon purpureus]|nr:hypothetical protein M758_4G245200 [Ceratodon purpureus]
MPESFITALDDRCFALEHFIESTGTRNAPSHGRRPPSIRNGYGRSQAAIADGNRLKAAIYTPKVQDVDLPFPTTDGDSQVPKQRGKRARSKSEGDEEPHKQISSPRKGSSIHYGVRFRPDLCKWVAEIRVAEWKDVDKKVWLGTFEAEESAARGVDLARKLLKCTKKKKFNLPCSELDQYDTEIPSHLDLTDIANEAMFKDVVSFIKNESQAYAARFPPATPLILTPPQLLPTPNPDTPLGYEEVDILWNDDNFELNLPDISDHLLIPDHPNMEELIISDFDMEGIFAEAFSPYSTSSLSSPPSSFTGQEFQFQTTTFQVQQSAMEMDLVVQPACYNLAAPYNLPQTWPGTASPSFQLPSGLQSEESSLYISPSDMTFDVANHWSLQGEQFQFQMDRN